MKALNQVVLVLLIIGGVNWLLVGLFSFDLVAAIFGGEVGEKSTFSRIIYTIVGLCALYAFRFLPLVNHDHHHDSVRR
ncbi:DUF378 domain-containing protein [Planococcus sp. YIM B11945]|uniref:DUF378 domain-containing protein n=1 Tax=Planococcus sp. YIM B11945 TaxID=3435410 RepID=UPI003D7E9C20